MAINIRVDSIVIRVDEADVRVDAPSITGTTKDMSVHILNTARPPGGFNTKIFVRQ